jgi:hypothetical protein
LVFFLPLSRPRKMMKAIAQMGTVREKHPAQDRPTREQPGTRLPTNPFSALCSSSSCTAHAMTFLMKSFWALTLKKTLSSRILATAPPRAIAIPY